MGGTVEIIKFCLNGQQKALHFLSTLAAFGPIGGVSGTEDVYEDSDMMDSLEALHQDMGYAQSKWVAEQILLKARERGLAVNIFRPGFIMCDSKTGACNASGTQKIIQTGLLVRPLHPYLTFSLFSNLLRRLHGPVHHCLLQARLLSHPSQPE